MADPAAGAFAEDGLAAWTNLIKDKTARCIQSFESLLRGDLEILNLEVDGNLTRFRVWAGNLGVQRDGGLPQFTNLNLDDALDVCERISILLEEVLETNAEIKDSLERTDYDEQVDSETAEILCSCVEDIVTSLFEVSVIISKTPIRGSESPKSSDGLEVNTQTSSQADLARIADTFPKIRDQPWLLQRLQKTLVELHRLAPTRPRDPSQDDVVISDQTIKGGQSAAATIIVGDQNAQTAIPGLGAYVCTFQDWKVGSFKDRDSWFSHELGTHRRVWPCLLCPNTFCASGSSLRDHLRSSHSRYYPLEIYNTIASASSPLADFSGTDCPLCNEWSAHMIGQASAEMFKCHVGRHMEELALSGMERVPYANEDDTSNAPGPSGREREVVSRPQLPMMTLGPYSTGTKEERRAIDSMSMAAELRAKGGTKPPEYQWISIACAHCRKRKIKCLVADGDPAGRCQNCIRLKKECVFYPVDSGNKAQKEPGGDPAINIGSQQPMEEALPPQLKNPRLPVTSDESYHKLVPEIKWAQRSSATNPEENILLLTILHPDAAADATRLEISEDRIRFRGTCTSRKAEYEVELGLYAAIDPQSSSTAYLEKSVEMILRKAQLDENYWPRLLKEKFKLPFVRTDFDQWVDEDEQDMCPRGPFAVTIGSHEWPDTNQYGSEIDDARFALDTKIPQTLPLFSHPTVPDLHEESQSAKLRLKSMRFAFTISPMSPKPGIEHSWSLQGRWRPPKALGNNLALPPLQYVADNDKCMVAASLPSDILFHKTFSIYYDRAIFWIVDFDATKRQVGDGSSMIFQHDDPMEGRIQYGFGEESSAFVDTKMNSPNAEDEVETRNYETDDWTPLMFDHRERDGLSYAGTRQPYRRMLTRRKDHAWHDQLLTDIHIATDFSDDPTRGGLVGELPLLIGLIAFAVPNAFRADEICNTVSTGKPWSTPNYPRAEGWMDRRGMVITTYAMPPHSTVEDLNRYEQGEYGRIFE